MSPVSDATPTRMLATVAADQVPVTMSLSDVCSSHHITLLLSPLER